MNNQFFKTSLAQQLKVLNIMIEKEMNSGLRKLGVNLTGTQVAVLMQLYQNTDQLTTQKQVEVALKLSHPTTRGIVKRLEATGLITTSPVPQNLRQVALKLTPAGSWFLTEKAEQIQKQVNHTEDKLVAQLSAEDQATLKRLLATLLKTMA